jgi:glycosyltransferase involved in cell wall biosynthesis
VSRVLFLLPSVPDPPDAGAKLRNVALMRLAAEQHSVDAIAFGEPDEEPRLAALADRARVVPLPKRTRVHRLATAARPNAPDMGERLWSPEFVRAVQCFLRDGRYEAVQAEAIEMGRYLSLAAPEQRIYDAHNPEFLLQRRASETSASVLARLYSRVQWRRLERFEAAVVRHSRLTLAVSEHDANQLLALAGQACVAVVPNGIDVASYPFRAPSTDDPPNILFVGKLDYRPNAEALRWLLERVLARLPHVRLFAVGANPPAWLVAAGQHDPRIAVVGYAADERRYLARCALLVLPVRIAAGTRLKALVAMASGLPIVSTQLGMEGLDVAAGCDYAVAESEDEWVQTIANLLRDADLRQRIANRARAVIERQYDWTALRPALHAAYARMAM